MAVRLADAERERKEANDELEITRAQMAVLGARVNELMDVVHGWDAIIAAKRKRDTEDASISATDSADGEDDGSRENKTQFVRDQIKAHAEGGMTAEDLKAAAKAVGMEHPPSWPYGPIQRLKEKGEIVKRKGRFYPHQQPLALAG